MGRYEGQIAYMVNGTLTVAADRLLIREAMVTGPASLDVTIERDPDRPVRLLPLPFGRGTFVRWNPTYHRWDLLFRGRSRRLQRDLDAAGWNVDVVRSWNPRRRHAAPAA